jgi:pimeloyl-ACP methyl ester carboxylesterase
MRKSRKATNIAISLGLLATLVGCEAGSEKAARPLDRFVKPLEWAPCTGEDAPEAPFECATMTAPLDYKNVKGETIDIAMIRIPASEAETKGVVLTNPGGPGASGFDSFVIAGEYEVSRLRLYEFDYVSFDPRGVDRSFGLKCYTDKELDLTMMTDETPDTDAEKKVVEEAEKIGDGCIEKYGEKLRHFSTENTARDMDLMRESMGFEQINYLGFSYGTYLGGVYATLFPEQVGAMVLDSAFDPAGDTPEEDALTQAVGFNETYNRFGEWCEDNDKCAFTTSDFNADWLALEKKLDTDSIVTRSGRFVNHNVLETATIQAFYSESTWPVLAKALQDARNGKGAGLLALADVYNGRDEDGHYSTSSNSRPLISCASGIVDKGSKNPAKMLKTAKQKAPWYFRNAEKSWFEESDCGKPFNDVEPIELRYSGDASIIVIGGDKDPATPFRWAEKMSKNLKGSVLVKYTGEGHGSVGINWCTTEIARLVLTVNISPPYVGTECGIDVPLQKPYWWEELTKSIPGVRYSGLKLGPQLGFPLAGFFTEFFVIRSDIDTSRKAIFQALLSNGLVNVSPEHDGVDDYVFFVHEFDCKIHVGVHFITLADLAATESGDPNVLLPEGSSMAVIYTYEDGAECH